MWQKLLQHTLKPKDFDGPAFIRWPQTQHVQRLNWKQRFKSIQSFYSVHSSSSSVDRNATWLDRRDFSRRSRFAMLVVTNRLQQRRGAATGVWQSELLLLSNSEPSDVSHFQTLVKWHYSHSFPLEPHKAYIKTFFHIRLLKTLMCKKSARLSLTSYRFTELIAGLLPRGQKSMNAYLVYVGNTFTVTTTKLES